MINFGSWPFDIQSMMVCVTLKLDAVNSGLCCCAVTSNLIYHLIKCHYIEKIHNNTVKTIEAIP